MSTVVESSVRNSVVGVSVAGVPSTGRFDQSHVEPVTVAVIADDAISADGLAASLRGAPRVTYLPADRLHQADIVVVAAIDVTEAVLSKIKSVQETATNPRQCVVMIADVTDERATARLFSYGVVSILSRRTATRESVVRAVIASGNGSAVLSGPLTRWVVDHGREFEHVIRSAHGILAGGLTVREVEIVRLLAEGMSTAEIASELSYAERTIKNVIRDLLVRLGVRNRTQAVAYAMRVGAI